MKADNEGIADLMGTLHARLRRLAEETLQLANVAATVSLTAYDSSTAWVSATGVDLDVGRCYICRRVIYSDSRRKKVSHADAPMIARWTAVVGWVDVLGYLPTTTASSAGIQVLI
jgi:hypothetical protein